MGDLFTSLQILYPSRLDFHRALKESPDGSLDVVVVHTAALIPLGLESLPTCLDESVRALRDGGLLFVQGRPEYLPELGVFLDRRLNFKEEYVRITREKVAAVGRGGCVRRGNGRKTQRAHTKKELQLEVRALAARLGRLPTPDDVEKMSPYEVKTLLDMFPTWGKALKAAKMENSVCVLPSGESSVTTAATERTERL